MRLQTEKKNKPQHASRLNRLVFGVALLWLVTSVLLLVLSTGSPQPDNKYEHMIDHTRMNAHQQLFARAEPSGRGSRFLYILILALF
jgi:preprotein translocase subunit SecG